MIVVYQKSNDRYQFALKGVATPQELEALMAHLSEVLRPQAGARIEVSLDCSEFEGESAPSEPASYD